MTSRAGARIAGLDQLPAPNYELGDPAVIDDVNKPSHLFHGCKKVRTLWQADEAVDSFIGSGLTLGLTPIALHLGTAEKPLLS